jgi:hypothetical protein
MVGKEGGAEKNVKVSIIGKVNGETAIDKMGD